LLKIIDGFRICLSVFQICLCFIVFLLLFFVLFFVVVVVVVFVLFLHSLCHHFHQRPMGLQEKESYKVSYYIHRWIIHEISEDMVMKELSLDAVITSRESSVVRFVAYSFLGSCPKC